jgi:hypothetical protein
MHGHYRVVFLICSSKEMDQVYVLCEIFDDWLQLSLLCGVDQDK